MNLLGRSLALCGLAALFSYLSNQVHIFFSILFLSTCVFLPWVIEKTDHARLRETLALRREGWILSLTLACLYVLVPFFFLWAVVHWFLHALFTTPGLEVFILIMAKGMVIFLPVAVAEEFFFRGYLQETIFSKRWGDRRIGPFRYRVLAVSALFAVTHVVGYLSPAKFFTFVAGLIFGRVVIVSRRSIWPAVVLHAFANAANEWLLAFYHMHFPWL